MNNIFSGFLKGFMNDQAEKISDRKSAANDFFNKQLQLAQQKALTYNTEYKGKMDAHVQVAKQLVGAGVPERTVMAIINQNPDDLSQFYETVQKMQMDGVDMSNPDVYDSLIEIDGEFNPGNENVTSLLQKMYEPLTNNAKADPEGFGFDPKGSIWATMLGYNAMGNAYERLKSTEVTPGVSAYDILSMPDDGGFTNPHPLGGASVGLNAYNAGVSVREAKKPQKDNTLSISEKNGIMSTFSDFVEEERIKGTADGRIVDENTSRRAAAARTIAMHPEAASIPEITKWLGGEESGVDESTTPPVAPTTIAPESPSEAPTAPPPSQATPVPKNSVGLPQRLPSGATLIRDNGDGTSTWKRPDGQEKTYDNNDIMKLMGSTAPTMQRTPTTGWLDRLGSEYDG